MNTLLIILSFFCLGYISGSLVERLVIRKKNNHTHTPTLLNPDKEVYDNDSHMTGDLEKSGMTSNHIQKYG
jgi:hypothetical protein